MSRLSGYTTYAITEDTEQAVLELMRNSTYSDANQKYIASFEVWCEQVGDFISNNESGVLEANFQWADCEIHLSGYDEDTDTFNLYFFDVYDKIIDLRTVPSIDAIYSEMIDSHKNIGYCVIFKFPPCKLRQRKHESFTMFLERVRQWTRDIGNAEVILYKPNYISGETPF